MIRAYDEIYLDDAMKNLGEAVDYAVCACEADIDDFFVMFINSGIADLFGKGVPKYVSGLSGTELAIDVLTKSGWGRDFPDARHTISLSPEYWCGWMLAEYQWSSGNSFRRILEYVKGIELLRLYPTLHEAPEQKSIDLLNKRLEKKTTGSKLQNIRESRGLSQKQLADKAGVNLRTLQQYEIRAKNINKAAATTLLALADTLGCHIEDLLEVENRHAEC